MKVFLSIALILMSTIVSAKTTTPKNVIVVVSDGMGPEYTSAYRYFKDDPNTPFVEPTILDQYLVGMASTYPSSESGFVTDSAAGATALLTGQKTYNGGVSVTTDKQPIETLAERASSKGKKIGVVVTSQINHATPASFLTHHENRRKYNEIADSYFDNKVRADIMLGGGWKYFIRKDRNLVKEFQDDGYHYIDNYDGLANLPKNKPVLGLFANKGLPWALDDSDKHRLKTMTKAALKQLNNSPSGFVLLVEASQVDWAGHRNDIASSMAEMDDLAATVEYLSSYVKNNPDTLVVITADHSTGGFSMGRDGKYIWAPKVLGEMSRSPKAMAKILHKKEITLELVNSLLPFKVTEKDVVQLKADKADAKVKVAAYKKLPKAEQKKLKKQKKAPDEVKLVYASLLRIIDRETSTGWTTIGHTAIDVPVYAFGKQHEIFRGYQDNTDIGKKLISLMN